MPSRDTERLLRSLNRPLPLAMCRREEERGPLEREAGWLWVVWIDFADVSMGELHSGEWLSNSGRGRFSGLSQLVVDAHIFQDFVLGDVPVTDH